MIKITDITIWGRDFSLNVDYDIFDNEEASQNQIDALNTFLSHSKWLDSAKKYVEDYCKRAVIADDNNNNKNNIFSYVKPDYIFVKNNCKKNRIALMCKYRYDEEHGIAVVFDREGNITIGSQDIIL